MGFQSVPQTISSILSTSARTGTNVDYWTSWKHACKLQCQLVGKGIKGVKSVKSSQSFCFLSSKYPRFWHALILILCGLFLMNVEDDHLLSFLFSEIVGNGKYNFCRFKYTPKTEIPREFVRHGTNTFLLLPSQLPASVNFHQTLNIHALPGLLWASSPQTCFGGSDGKYYCSDAKKLNQWDNIASSSWQPDGIKLCINQS